MHSFSDVTQPIQLAMILHLMQAVLANRPAFDPDLAQKASYWAATAYYPKEQIQKSSCHYCQRFKLTDFSFHQVFFWDLQAYVSYYSPDNLIVVAFRGTIDLQEWLQDFQIELIQYKDCQDCRVHRGFFRALQFFNSFISTTLKNYRIKYPAANIFVTGHSLGASMALLAALQISKAHPNLIAAYTLGQPRTGNKEFAQYAYSKIQIYRMVHNLDLVPHIPTRTSIRLYQQNNRQVWYNKNMTKSGFILCKQERDKECSEGRTGYTMAEHAANFYVIQQDEALN